MTQTAGPRDRTRDVLPRGAHLVTFHEATDELVAEIVDHIRPILGSGGCAVIIAESSRWVPVRDRLAAVGIDADAAARDGYLRFIGARELLERISRDHVADPALFAEHVGAVMDEAFALSPRVTAFGEMVALAYEDGDVLLAIEIEQMWNELQREHTFDLLCGYPTTVVEQDEHTADFRSICEAHNGVASPMGELTDAATERLRAFAKLSQDHARARREESHLRAAMDLLVELDRQRREFTAMVVHDIRSPNSIVEGALKLLRDGRDDLTREEIDDLLDRSLSQSRRVDRLAEDILTMSRLDAGEFTYDLTEFDLGDVLEVATGQLVETRDWDVALIRPEGLPRVVADEGRQVQILENLLSNAVKFSDGAHVSIEVEQRGDEIAITVTDRGPGLSESDLESIFRPFSRTSRQARGGKAGTGLGLYITRALVEGQGGSISVESSPGEGSRFRWTVPVAPPV